MWMTSCTWSARGDFWRTSVSWVLRSEEGWLSLARSGLVAGATRVGWVGMQMESHHRKIVHLFLMSKPLTQKVIKGFVPELRCNVFFVFRDSYVLCIYVMNILCTFPIFMYGYITTDYYSFCVTVLGNGHGDTSSNPGRDSLHFTEH